jgi:hypothetical protein
MTRIARLLIAGLLATATVTGCGGGAKPVNPFPTGDAGAPEPSGPGRSAEFVVSQAQFEQMFPDRDPFYDYDGLMRSIGSFPSFATTGDHATRLREAAAFFANIDHETDGLRVLVEANTANYGNYCDAGKPYGCPAGNDAYFGRGPVQLSWNYNYRAAGDALGLDLLTDPGVVARDEGVAWKTALWFWNTQASGSPQTAHGAMVGGAGFGATIRVFNGEQECDGHNPQQVRDRVDSYQRITKLLGVAPGDNLSC